MTLLESANAAVRFGLELSAIGALGYWGFSVGDGLPIDLVLGLGTPLAFALVWGAFIGPKAPLRLYDPQRLSLEVVVFGLAVVGLADAEASLLAVLMAVVVAANLGFMIILGQRRVGGI